jgi:pyruvate/2-oxoglutarate dehydrogenase complex dihydrolipoamide dehydrogenase (E3) component
MLGHIRTKHTNHDGQDTVHMSRVYVDLYRSPHHSAASPDGKSVEMQQAIRPKGKIPNIAIIGAGISGLRCADVLLRNGARVTIYEARDRIGGRVCRAWSWPEDQKLMYSRYIKLCRVAI